MENLRKISLSGTKDAQELVNILGDYSGDYLFIVCLFVLLWNHQMK